MTDHQPLSETPPHAVGFETRDVSIRGILALAGAVLASVLIVVAGLWWMWTRFEMQAARSETKPTFTRDEQPRTTSPHLQETPVRDYVLYRAEQDAAASTYGWVDRNNGVVRLPVDRAMELYLERGAPPSWPNETKPEEPAP
ncbi:MAG TPA: hypothetical protein VFG20_06970 [Planctomycetaceae bacterium]|nr:hypothetical protein [Planctomycetaceae bacterium]